MTLYLKYRPQTINDLDNQKVRETLTSVLSQKDIPHGFLFSGPKGTGKTSAARIVAKALNCTGDRGGGVEPCNKCEQCISVTNGTNIDVVEIDAASHRGIDDVRDLREAVKLSAVSARKKVYIIDEVHMLTTEAANAFLKTLEEPPTHVVFILATTNPEKLIDTVKSRLTSVSFKKATQKEIERQLERVMKGEKVDADEGVVSLIVKGANGSFRDAANILEQLIRGRKHLTLSEVESELANPGVTKTEEFALLLKSRDRKRLLKYIESIVENGGSIDTFVKDTLSFFHKDLLSIVGIESERLTEFSLSEIEFLITLFSAANEDLANAYLEQIPVELAILKWCKESQKPEDDKEESKTKQVKEEVKEKVLIKKTISQPIESDVALSTVVEESCDDMNLDTEAWQKVLEEIRGKNISVEALLRSAKPLSFDGKNLRLGVYYRFHKERLEASLNRSVVEATVEKVIGNPVRILCSLTEPPIRPKVEEEISTLTQAVDPDIMMAAKEIFEG